MGEVESGRLYNSKPVHVYYISMVTQQTRAHIWYRLASMERYVRYYELLYKRYRIHRFVSKGMIGVGSTGLLSVFLSGVDSVLITHGLAIGLAGVAVWDLIEDPSDKAATLARIGKDMGRLHLEYETLWDQLESGSLTDDQAIRRSNELFNQIYVILERFDVGTSERLNSRAAKAAYTHLTSRYRHAA